MIRIAAGLGLAVLTLAGAASAQTWGQPVYVSPYGGVAGGTPLSEIETRSYVSTGRWADGYTDHAYVHAPAPVDDGRSGYARGYGHHGGYGHGHPAHGHSRYAPPPRPGYRDVWDYNDDRPPSARHGSRERRSHHDDRDCGCGDVYFYDR